MMKWMVKGTALDKVNSELHRGRNFATRSVCPASAWLHQQLHVPFRILHETMTVSSKP